MKNKKCADKKITDMAELPLVSIIMPAYNCKNYIGEAILSVQKQTYEKWELFIVDDCSTDNTAEIIQQFSEHDTRIHYYKLNSNSGAAIARNLAMEKATGDYMAFLDADDLWMEEKLERQVKFMLENDYYFSCTAYEWIDESGLPKNKIIRTIPKTDYNRLLLDCPVGNSTIVYDIRMLGKFKAPNVRKRNDYALWLEMARPGNCIYGLNEVLAQYRIRSDSISGNKLKVVKYQWNVYRNIEHLNIARCVFHICYYGLIKILKIK